MEKKEELEILRKKVLEELKCPLRESAKNLVFGKGNPEAKVMFIGEAPGRNEDLEGLPFVGAAGKQLDRLLGLAGLGIEDVYIANILKYRPPNNRDPKTEEIEMHTPYLVEQIKIIKPKIIVTLGNFSTKFVLNGFKVKGMAGIEGITKLHGKEREVKLGGLSFIVMPMYHPAAMLYNPGLKGVIERDFKKLKELI